MFALCFQSIAGRGNVRRSKTLLDIVPRFSSTNQKPDENVSDDSPHAKRLAQDIKRITEISEKVHAGVKLGKKWRFDIETFSFSNLAPDKVPEGYQMVFRNPLEKFANFSIAGAGFMVIGYNYCWRYRLFILHFCFIGFCRFTSPLRAFIWIYQFNHWTIWAGNPQHWCCGRGSIPLLYQPEGSHAYLLFRSERRFPSPHASNYTVAYLPNGARARPAYTTSCPSCLLSLARHATQAYPNRSKTAALRRGFRFTSVLQQINGLPSKVNNRPNKCVEHHFITSL